MSPSGIDLPRRERMPARKSRDERLLPHELRADPRLGDRRAQEADVDGAVAQRLHLMLRRELTEHDLDDGELVPEGAHDLGQAAVRERRGIRDDDATALASARAPRLVHRDVDGLEDEPRVVEEDDGGGRELDLTAGCARRA